MAALRAAAPALARLAAARCAPAAAFANAADPAPSGDPLKTDPKTARNQELSEKTKDATDDSIRHAAEGDVGAAVKDVGRMAAAAAKGAAASAKLMAERATQRGAQKAKGEE
jgi:hypothetical protein